MGSEEESHDTVDKMMASQEMTKAKGKDKDKGKRGKDEVSIKASVKAASTHMLRKDAATAKLLKEKEAAKIYHSSLDPIEDPDQPSDPKRRPAQGTSLRP